jgi:hypothetical protein
MTLQLFVPSGADLSHVSVLAENDARAVPVGSPEFFDYYEGVKGRRRVVVSAKAGETIDAIGRRYGVSAASMERINRRGRGEALKEGQTVIVYTAPSPSGAASKPDPSTAGATLFDGRDARVEPVPNGPLPEAPYPQGLPPLP